MTKKRHLLRNEAGYSSVLETLISVGISITLLTVFFYSANTLYEVQDNPESNLESKTMGIMETLITSTGQDISQSSEWQHGTIPSFVGLSINPTVEYGVVTINETTKKTTINISYSFDQNEYGLESTCFLAGTKVVMTDGSYKNIEDIVVGDMVKCYDQMKREIVDSIVTHVFHHHPEEMGEYYLVINDQLRVTPNHLIYSDAGWIEASDLKIGDSLFYPSTDYPVSSINKVFDRVETFNIEVEGLHNYFVAMNDVDALVHNVPPTHPVVANPGGPYQGARDVDIQFQGSASEGTPPYTYKWEFGDGTESNWLGPFGVGVTCYEDHPYAEEGLYDVNLTVRDSTTPTPVYDTKSTTAAISNVPIARFKWFDKDGLGGGKTVFFNAGESAGGNLEYWWDWNSTGTYYEATTFYIEKSGYFVSGQKYRVTLKVNNTEGYDTVTHTVEVNTIGPEPDSRPWVLTGKDLWPEGSFSSYDEGYYIVYTPINYDFTKGGAFPNDERKMYMYEVKRVTSTVKPILDILKIETLTSGIPIYELVKSTFGLDEEIDGAIMNFNISVEIEGDPAHPEPLYFGASDQENTLAKEATSRRVLIYYHPKGGAGGISGPPEYKHGEITVRVFLGGTPPQKSQ